MPLQKPDTTPIANAERARLDALCAQARREFGAKERLAQALLTVIVSLAIGAIAWSLWHG